MFEALFCNFPNIAPICGAGPVSIVSSHSSVNVFCPRKGMSGQTIVKALTDLQGQCYHYSAQ